MELNEKEIQTVKNATANMTIEFQYRTVDTCTYLLGHDWLLDIRSNFDSKFYPRQSDGHFLGGRFYKDCQISSPELLAAYREAAKDAQDRFITGKGLPPIPKKHWINQ